MLSDPETRARYDRFGEAGVGGAGSAGPNLGDMFGGGGLGDLFDAFFGGRAATRSAAAWPGRSAAWTGPRGRRRHRVRAAVFGATVPGHGPHRGALRRLRRVAAPAEGTKPVTCSRVQRARSGAAGASEPARADGHRHRVCPKCSGARPGHRHPVPDVQRRGPDRSPRRRTRSTCPPVSTPARRCGSPAAAPSGRAAAAPATSTSTSASPRTSASSATATTSSRISPCRSPRPRSAPRSTLRDARRRRGDRRPAGHAARPASSCSAATGVPRLQRPRPRRPARARRRRGADEAHRRRRPSCCASSPRCAASRSAPPSTGCSRGSSPPSREPAAARARRGARVRRRRSAQPELDRRRPRITSAACCGSATDRRSRSATGVAGGRRRGLAAGGLTCDRRGAIADRRRCRRDDRRGDPEGRSAGVDRAEADRDRCRPRSASCDCARSVVRWDARRAVRSATGCAGSPARRRCRAGVCGCPTCAVRCRSPTCVGVDEWCRWPSRTAAPLDALDAPTATVVIGPEGGFDPTEDAPVRRPRRRSATTCCAWRPRRSSRRSCSCTAVTLPIDRCGWSQLSPCVVKRRLPITADVSDRESAEREQEIGAMRDFDEDELRRRRTAGRSASVCASSAGRSDCRCKRSRATSTEEFKASVLGAYERGERAISVPRLERLAKFYNGAGRSAAAPRGHLGAGRRAPTTRRRWRSTCVKLEPADAASRSRC